MSKTSLSILLCSCIVFCASIDLCSIFLLIFLVILHQREVLSLSNQKHIKSEKLNETVFCELIHHINHYFATLNTFPNAGIIFPNLMHTTRKVQYKQF